MIVSGKTELQSITHTLTHVSITGPFSHVKEVIGLMDYSQILKAIVQK